MWGLIVSKYETQPRHRLAVAALRRAWWKQVKNVKHLSQTHTKCKAPICFCHSELHRSTCSPLFHTPFNCTVIEQSPSSLHNNVCNKQEFSYSLSFQLFIIVLLHFFFILITRTLILIITAVRSNFYSSNWSPPLFNRISIILLNGFKNSLVLMWASKNPYVDLETVFETCTIWQN